MVINIAVALLSHHIVLLINRSLSFTVVFEDRNLVALNYTLLAYFGTVLMFLFAAESVNLFVKMTLVFSEINNYVKKATIIAWSKNMYLYT